MWDNGYTEKRIQVFLIGETDMSGLTIVLILIGVGYSAATLTKFLVWLDTPKKRCRG